MKLEGSSSSLEDTAIGLDANVFLRPAGHPRAPFQEIGALRKRTRTPPGFRDDGDGDFFIWVDLLTGLLDAQVRGDKYGRVALVSLDKKVDWSRAGIAHPILVAEVRTLLNVPFEIWTIDKLATEIAKAP